MVVQEKDVLDAESLYSQFAIDSLLVEDGASLAEPIEGIILEFLGCSRRLDFERVSSFIERAKIPASMVESAVEHLCALTFLGPEVRDGVFAFADDPQENKKNQILARNLSEMRGKPRQFEIHPAYWRYLEVT